MRKNSNKEAAAMGFIDELKKLTHPYEDEYEEFEEF